jgi:hypothetical protein
MTKITKDNKKEFLASVEKWAKANKAKMFGVTDNGEPAQKPDESHVAFHVEGKDWGVEVRPENGWAFLHGYNSLEGYGTNIDDMTDLDGAIKRLQKAAKGDK